MPHRKNRPEQDIDATLDALEHGSDQRPDWLEDDPVDLDHVHIPHISIHVFSETDRFGEVWQHVARDRHMSKTSITENAGGFVAAIKHYIQSTTPELLIVETRANLDVLEYELDALAEVCDPGTRLVVVGHNNDVQLYRRLIQLGVSNYIVFPCHESQVIQAIAEIYAEPDTAKIGRSYAFIGAKGGVGTSSLAQSVAFELSRATESDVLLVDLDIPFGTASLNLDVEPNQGLIELLDRPDLISAETLDRVLIKYGLHLNVLGAVPGVEVDRDVSPEAISALLEISQIHLPHVLLDVPHTWTDWTRQVLRDVDRVVIVSTPEVASLRNAAAMIARTAELRPNDPKPLLVLDQTGMPRRDEIALKDISSTLKLTPAAAVPFDPRLFNEAAGRGKLIGEIAPRKPASAACREIADILNPKRQTAQPAKSRGFSLWSRKAG